MIQKIQRGTTSDSLWQAYIFQLVCQVSLNLPFVYYNWLVKTRYAEPYGKLHREIVRPKHGLYVVNNNTFTFKMIEIRCFFLKEFELFSVVFSYKHQIHIG